MTGPLATASESELYHLISVTCFNAYFKDKLFSGMRVKFVLCSSNHFNSMLINAHSSFYNLNATMKIKDIRDI